MHKEEKMAEMKEMDMEKTEYTTKELIDQIETIKTSPFGYNKEEVYSFVQTLLRAMENEKKKETEQRFQQIQVLQSDKRKLTAQKEQAEASLRETDRELEEAKAELEKLRKEKDEIQNKFNAFTETLKEISENAIARDQELADFHRREVEIGNREKELALQEEKKRQELEKARKEFLGQLEIQKNEILANAENQRKEILRKAQTEAESILNKGVFVKKELVKLEEMLRPVFDWGKNS